MDEPTLICCTNACFFIHKQHFTESETGPVFNRILQEPKELAFATFSHMGNSQYLRIFPLDKTDLDHLYLY
jgi:hypothetical protein